MEVVFLFPTLPEVPRAAKPWFMQTGKLYTISNYHIVCTGPGSNIKVTMRRLAPQLSGKALVLLGYAGATTPELLSGDLVVCDSFRMVSAPTVYSKKFSTQVKKILELQGLPVVAGSSYTSSSIINSLHVKKALARKSVLVVEMENYFAAQVANELTVPFTSVRLILDTFTEQLPDLMDTIQPSGALSIYRSLLHLIHFPGHLWPMLKIFRSSHNLLPVFYQCCTSIARELSSCPVA